LKLTATVPPASRWQDLRDHGRRCWFLKRPQEGIVPSEKAIGYYETHGPLQSSAADGYNNLGINLILIGQWDRAHEALDKALTLASEIDERGGKVPMIGFAWRFAPAARQL